MFGHSEINPYLCNGTTFKTTSNMKFNVTDNYIDEIIVSDRTKEARKAVKAAGLSFDGFGECEIEMDFRDGMAFDTKGIGLVMSYPSMSEVKASEKMQREITEYTGIHTDINQYDVAMKYGVLHVSE